MNFKKYKIIELAGHSILSNNINIKNTYIKTLKNINTKILCLEKGGQL